MQFTAAAAASGVGRFNTMIAGLDSGTGFVGFATIPDIGSCNPNVFNRWAATRIYNIGSDGFVFGLAEANLPDDDTTWSQVSFTGNFAGGSNPRTVTYIRSTRDSVSSVGQETSWLFTISPDDFFVNGESYETETQYSAQPDVPPQQDEELIENASTIFIDPALGSDANNGLFATDQGAGNGPKQTPNGVNALDLSSITGIYQKVGTTITCETQGRIWNQDDFKGAPGAYAVIGAYYMDASTPRRGLGGNTMPIMQGTVARPHDYNGANVIGNSNVFPTASSTRAADGGLLGWDNSGNPSVDAYIRVENLHVRHSGGKGIFFRELNHIEVYSCLAELCLASGIRVHHDNGGSDYLFDSNYVTGCGGTQQWYNHNTRPHVLSLRGEMTNAIVRNNTVWQNWGESMGCGRGKMRDLLFEDNIVWDNKHVHLYMTAVRDSVFRRNISFQTGKNANNYSSITLANAMSINGAEENEGISGSNQKTGNCAVYANLMIASNKSFVFWDQDSNPNKVPPASGLPSEFDDFYIFRNTSIHPGFEEYGEIGSTWRGTSSGRIQDNMHIADTHVIDSDFPRSPGWPRSRNSWSDAVSAPGWNGDIIGDVYDGEDSASVMQNLHTLAVWSADNHIEFADIDNFISQVKALIGKPTGAAIGGGNSNNGHPVSVSYAYEDKDVFGNDYVTDDIGAVAA